MKTSISQYFCIFATTSMLVTGVAEGDTNNTVKDKSKSIEQATTALNEAKTAIESAQNTLSEAQKDQQTSRLKSKKTSTPTSQGPLYKCVDEY
jgi:peptidoglycan hydrolase CwlO-like protein